MKLPQLPTPPEGYVWTTPTCERTNRSNIPVQGTMAFFHENGNSTHWLVTNRGVYGGKYSYPVWRVFAVKEPNWQEKQRKYKENKEKIAALQEKNNLLFRDIVKGIKVGDVFQNEKGETAMLVSDGKYSFVYLSGEKIGGFGPRYIHKSEFVKEILDKWEKVG